MTDDTARPRRLELIAVGGLPEFDVGDDIAAVIVERLRACDVDVHTGDVLVVTQKIVSKVEGRLRRLADVAITPEAASLAVSCELDPPVVQLVLDESAAVLRHKTGILMVQHRLGFVIANAGVDQSNVPAGHALLLPADCDDSARRIRDRLFELTPQRRIAVIVSDSMGRPWRNGTLGHALGVAGLDPVVDLRGRPDRSGRPLRKTRIAAADALAAAATLLMGEAAEGTPVVLVRGYAPSSDHVGIQPLIRTPDHELFR